jgi:hypothetical protein
LDRSDHPKVQQLRPAKFDRLTVTTTGQISASLNSLTVEAIARRDAARLMPHARAIADQDSLSRLQSNVRADVRRLAGVSADLTQLPNATLSLLKQAAGYWTESLKISVELLRHVPPRGRADAVAPRGLAAR